MCDTCILLLIWHVSSPHPLLRRTMWWTFPAAREEVLWPTLHGCVRERESERESERERERESERERARVTPLENARRLETLLNWLYSTGGLLHIPSPCVTCLRPQISGPTLPYIGHILRHCQKSSILATLLRTHTETQRPYIGHILRHCQMSLILETLQHTHALLVTLRVPNVFLMCS